MTIIAGDCYCGGLVCSSYMHTLLVLFLLRMSQLRLLYSSLIIIISLLWHIVNVRCLARIPVCVFAILDATPAFFVLLIPFSQFLPLHFVAVVSFPVVSCLLFSVSPFIITEQHMSILYIRQIMTNDINDRGRFTALFAVQRHTVYKNDSDYCSAVDAIHVTRVLYQASIDRCRRHG